MAKLNDTTINGTLTVSNINGYTVGAKSWFGQIPTIRSNDGVMEIGQYIDFHVNNTTSSDYDGRLRAVAGGGELAFPTKSGTIALTSDLPTLATTSSAGLMSAADKIKLNSTYTVILSGTAYSGTVRR